MCYLDTLVVYPPTHLVRRITRIPNWSAHARTMGVGLKAKPWQYICAVVVVQNTLQKFSETKLELWVRFGGHFWLYPGTRQLIIIQNYGGKG